MLVAVGSKIMSLPMDGYGLTFIIKATPPTSAQVPADGLS